MAVVYRMASARNGGEVAESQNGSEPGTGVKAVVRASLVMNMARRSVRCNDGLAVASGEWPGMSGGQK